MSPSQKPKFKFFQLEPRMMMDAAAASVAADQLYVDMTVDDVNAIEGEFGVHYSQDTGNFYKYINQDSNYNSADNVADSQQAILGANAHLLQIESEGEENALIDMDLTNDAVWLNADKPSATGDIGDMKWKDGYVSGLEIDQVDKVYQGDIPGNDNNTHATFKATGSENYTHVKDSSTQGVLVEYESGEMLDALGRSTAFTVSEDASDGHAIVDLNSESSNPNYQFFAAGGKTENPNNLFAIDADSGLITVNNAAELDFESKDSYTLLVTYESNNGSTIFREITINVADANEAPTDIKLDSNNTADVDEQAFDGTKVADVNITDQNSGDTHAVTIQSVSGASGADYSDAFEINANNELIVKDGSVLDHETDVEIQITLEVADQDGVTHTEQFDITINDLTSPLFVSETSILDEHSASGTQVFEFVTNNPDGAAYDFTFTNTESWIGAFDIDATSGEVTILDSSKLDYEAAGVVNGVMTLQIKEQNTGTTGTVGVKLTDINETPTDITISNNTIEEMSPLGDVIGVLGTSDPDSGETFTYNITGGNTDNAFAIDGDKLVVTNANLDFDGQNSWSLDVEVSDSQGNQFTKTLIINLSDESNPVFGDAGVNTTIDENGANGTVLFSALAVDPDSGSAITYSISGSTFSIDENSGEVTVFNVNDLDFETHPTHTFDITATDPNGAASTQTYTVTLNDINEAPTAIAIDTNTVKENAIKGTPVGQLSVTDEDADDSHTLTILSTTDTSGNDLSGAFIITNEGKLVVDNPLYLDFESTPTIDVKILATDAGGETREETITINLEDFESTNFGSFLSDPPGDTKWANDAFPASFVITPDTIISFMSEIQSTNMDYTVVQLRDADENVLLSIDVNGSEEIDYSKRLSDLDPSLVGKEVASVNLVWNDNFSGKFMKVSDFTVHDKNTPPTLTDVSANLSERADKQTLVHNFNDNSGPGTVDAESPDNLLSYSIVEGNENGVFSINDFGELRVSDPTLLDFENNPVMNLTVAVSDGTYSDTATITINLSDAEEDLIASPDSAIMTPFMNSITVDVTANDANPDYQDDGSTPDETLEITGASSNDGTVVINPDGTVTFTPNEGFVGKALVTYDIESADGNAGVGELVISVQSEAQNAVQDITGLQWHIDANNINGSLKTFSDDEQLGDGNTLNSFVDSSGNENPMSTGADNGNTLPTLKNDVFASGKEGIQFNKEAANEREYIQVEDAGNFADKTFALTFHLDAANTGVIFEVGSEKNGMALTLNNGELFARVWDTQTASETSISLGYVEAGEDYSVIMTLDDTSDTFATSLNGAEFKSADFEGGKVTKQALYLGATNHGQNQKIPGNDGNWYNGFQGSVGEMYAFDRALDAAEADILNNAFAEKWLDDPIQNDAPVIAASITLTESATVTLDSGMLIGTDSDSENEALTYTVNPAKGFFALTSAPDVPIFSFTQAQVNSGEVLFDTNGEFEDVKNGETEMYNVNLTVNDSQADTSQTLKIQIQGEPNAPDLQDNMTATDADSPVSLTFTGNDSIDGHVESAFYDPENNIFVDTLKGSDSGTFTLDDKQTLTFDPGGDFDSLGAGETGTTTAQVVISDSATQNFSISPEQVQTITITVTGVNDDVTISPTTPITVSDAIPAGQTVALIEADDPDTNDVLQFSIAGGNADGIFAIDPNSGAITIADPTSILSGSSHDLTLEVTDNNGSTKSVVQNITFSSTPPQNNSAPTLASLPDITLSDDVGDGATVTTLSATDSDGDAITYAITSGNDDGIFTIDSATGEITIADTDQIDQQNTVEHTLEITVSDTYGSSSLSSQKITLTEINEGPTLSANDQSITESTTIDLSNSLSSSDNESADSDLDYTITPHANFEIKVNGVVQNSFTQEDLNNNLVTLSFTGDVSEDTAESLDVTVTDSGGLSQSVTLGITVTPDPEVNVAPDVTGNAQSTTYSEDGTAADVFDITTLTTNNTDTTMELVTFTIENLADGAQEHITVNNMTVALSDSTTLIAPDTNLIISLSGGTATVTIENTSGSMSESLARHYLNSLTYENRSNTPDTSQNRVFTLTSVKEGTGEAFAPSGITGTVSLSPTNDGPVISTDATASVMEGGSFTLDTTHLNASDIEDADASLTFQATLAGTPFSLTVDGTATDTFTLQELIDGKVEITHDGNANTSHQFLEFTVTDSGGASVSDQIHVDVGENPDAPSLSANGTDPTFTEAGVGEPGTPVTLFDSISLSSANTHEPIQSVTLTLDGIQDGAQEQLLINGVVVELKDGEMLIAEDGTEVHILMQGTSPDTATITIQRADGSSTISESAMTALLESIQYQNVSDTTHEGIRTVTLTSMTDQGNLTTFTAISSSVTVVSANDAPQLDTFDGVSLIEGQTHILDGSELTATDIDSSVTPAQLVYSIDSMPNAFGIQTFDGIDWNDASTFTQEQVNKGEVRITHNGYHNLGDKTLTLSVSDGTDSTSANLTVHVLNSNDAPTLSAPDQTLIDDVTNGTEVTTLNAADVDGDAITYAITAGNDDGIFALDPVTGQLTILDASQIPQNQDTDYTLTIAVTDQGSPPKTTEITQKVTFTEHNAAPEIVSTENITMLEGETLILSPDTLVSSDVDDTSEERTWELTGALHASTNLEVYDNNTGTWVQASQFTQAQLNQGQVRVVHDGSNDLATQTLDFKLYDGKEDGASEQTTSITLSFTNINDGPDISGSGKTVSFVEELTGADGSIQGGAAVDLFDTIQLDTKDDAATFTDIDSVLFKSVTMEFSGLADGSHETLLIGTQTVALDTDQTLTIDADKNILLDVTITGGTATLTLYHEYGVGDKADFETLLEGMQYQNTSENPDTANRTLTIKSITDGMGTANGGTDTKNNVNISTTIQVERSNDAAQIDTNTGLTILEDGGFILTTAMLNVSDVDDAPSEITWQVDNAGEFQITKSGNVVTSFTHQDVIDGTIHVEHTGDVKDTTETKNIQFTLIEGAHDGNEIQQNVTFTVTAENINDAPILNATGSNSTITEGDAGVSVFDNATADTSDNVDAMESVTFTIENVLDGADEILNLNGVNFAIEPGTYALNDGFEAQVTLSGSTATLVVSHTSGSMSAVQLQTLMNTMTYQNTSENPSHTEDRIFTLTEVKDTGGTANGGVDTTALTIASSIDVVPINDAPDISLTSQIGLDETVPVGTAVADIDATDEENNTLTYSITGGNADGIFGIDSATGEITVISIKNLNFEITHSYNLTITVQDDGEPEPKSSTVQQAITINDMNEAPVITTNKMISVLEGDSTTITSAMLSAVDEDFSDTATDITYTVGGLSGSNLTITVDGVQQNSFTQADVDAGKVIVNRDDVNGNQIYNLNLQLTDGGEDGVAPVMTTLQIQKIDINDAPGMQADALNQEFVENEAAQTIFENVTIDPDETWQTITNLVINVEGVKDPESEILNFGNQTLKLSNGSALSLGGGTVTYENGQLLFTGSFAPKALETILETMTYENDTENPTGGERTFTLSSITDSGGTINGGIDTTALDIQSTIQVTPVNDLPVLQDLVATDSVVAGKSISMSLDGLYSDIDDTLGSGNVVNAFSESGEVRYDPNTGILTFTPDGNFKGQAIITYEVSDGEAVVSGKIFVNVTPRPFVVEFDDPVKSNDTAFANTDAVGALRDTEQILDFQRDLYRDDKIALFSFAATDVNVRVFQDTYYDGAIQQTDSNYIEEERTVMFDLNEYAKEPLWIEQWDRIFESLELTDAQLTEEEEKRKFAEEEESGSFSDSLFSTRTQFDAERVSLEGKIT